jgi:preprotein translocase subunit SecD
MGVDSNVLVFERIKEERAPARRGADAEHPNRAAQVTGRIR